MGEYANKWMIAIGPDKDGEIEIAPNCQADDLIWLTKEDLEAMLALFE